MKIAIAQINPIVGNLEYNFQKIINYYNEAALCGADLVVFPECSLTGYPLEDLVLNKAFLDDVNTYIEKLRVKIIFKIDSDPTLIVGAPRLYENKIYNSAYVFSPGKKLPQIVDKIELPNFGVFDEKRVFTSGLNMLPVDIQEYGKSVRKIGIMICEDGWHSSVNKAISNNGAELLICINGSPYEQGKNIVRENEIKNRSLETNGLPVIYVNIVGGQDELIFDGGSFILKNHTKYKQMAFFKEELSCIEYDFDSKEFIKPDFIQSLDLTPPTDIQSVYQALVLGLRDYTLKNNFKEVVLGMSGGVDSALVASIACDALGSDKVHLLRMPSQYSSEGSLNDAEYSSKLMGIKSIDTIYIENTYKSLKDFLPITLTGIADENLQARIRGMILMSYSNQNGWLVLSTGNKSEVSVGYGTLGGDLMGGFNPIKDIYKTMVWDLCRWRNIQKNVISMQFYGNDGIVIPDTIINKKPSAELRPDQLDEQSLPPYPVLDKILYNLIEKNQSVVDLIKLGEDEKVVRKVSNLLRIAEYKRRMSPPGVKITTKHFGRDRRYPIINGWVE